MELVPLACEDASVTERGTNLRCIVNYLAYNLSHFYRFLTSVSDRFKAYLIRFGTKLHQGWQNTGIYEYFPSGREIQGFPGNYLGNIRVFPTLPLSHSCKFTFLVYNEELKFL